MKTPWPRRREAFSSLLPQRPPGTVPVRRALDTRHAPEEDEDRAFSFRDLVDHSLGLICAHDLDGALLSVNAVVADLLGYEAGELAGKNLRDLLAPQVRQMFDGYLSRLRRFGSDSGYMRVLTKAGDERLFYYRNRVWERPGHPPSVLGHAHDVTDQKRLEDELSQRLRESEARYRSLFEDSPVGIYRTTPAGEILLVNPALLRMLGYPSREMLQAHNLEQRADAPYSRKLFRELVEDEDGITGLEAQWTRRDGTRMWMRENAKTVRDADGNVLYYEGTVEDISAPKRAQEELISSHARRATIVEAALDGILTLDADGRICEFNPAAEGVLGWPPDEALGLHLSELIILPGFEPGGTETLETYLARADGVVLGRRIESLGLRPNGARFPLELAITRLPGAGPATFTAFLRDLSERHEIERLKTQFVATVSHELRTPLTSLRGALGLLAGGVLGDLPADARAAVGIAERSILRLVGLVNDILDIERIENGRLALNYERHSLAALLTRSMDEVGALAQEGGIRLKADHPTGTVLGDGDRLVQVIVNLLSNALKFSPRGSAVHLRAEEKGAWVEVQVEDRGRGIPASHIEVIFDRFRQVELSDAGQRGVGLGLAIAKSIVELHGGVIGVSSEEGKGSTFWFRIPRGA